MSGPSTNSSTEEPEKGFWQDILTAEAPIYLMVLIFLALIICICFCRILIKTIQAKSRRKSDHFTVAYMSQPTANPKSIPNADREPNVSLDGDFDIVTNVRMPINHQQFHPSKMMDIKEDMDLDEDDTSMYNHEMQDTIGSAGLQNIDPQRYKSSNAGMRSASESKQYSTKALHHGGQNKSCTSLSEGRKNTIDSRDNVISSMNSSRFILSNASTMSFNSGSDANGKYNKTNGLAESEFEVVGSEKVTPGLGASLAPVDSASKTVKTSSV